MARPTDEKTRQRFGIAVATITGIGYFILLVLGAINPAVLQQPLLSEGRFSVGLFSGAMLVLFIIVCGAIYTFGMSHPGDDA